MNALTRYMLPLAGALAAAVGCAHERSRTPAEQTRAAEEQSQKAYGSAAAEQEQLAEQQKRVDAAHQDAVKAQEQLTLAQTHEEQERAKADQLKRQSAQHLEEARQEAQHAYGATSRGQRQGSAAGRIAEATADQIVLETPSGGTMTFRVDDRTTVLIGGEQHSAADIQQGADALVGYDTSQGGQQSAIMIQVTPAQPAPRQ